MKPIQQLQKKLGLIQDGIIGRLTLAKMMSEWGLSKEQLAHFLGQTSNETGDFQVRYENLNYSEKTLLAIFPTRVDKETATKIRRNPKEIANLVYGNRYGNTDEGDGWKYRGRGSIQLTFKDNYKRMEKLLNIHCLVEHPDLVAEEYFWDSGVAFFKDSGAIHLANEVTQEAIRKVTRRVNGGYNGLDNRIATTQRYYNLIEENLFNN